MRLECRAAALVVFGQQAALGAVSPALWLAAYGLLGISQFQISLPLAVAMETEWAGIRILH